MSLRMKLTLYAQEDREYNCMYNVIYNNENLLNEYFFEQIIVISVNLLLISV